MGKDDTLVLFDKLKQAYDAQTRVLEPLHKLYGDLFKDYMVCGGMPAAVGAYIDKKPLVDILSVQRNIVRDCLNDMVKYAKASDKIKVRECFESVLVQLAKENKKFPYKVVKAGYSARHYESSLKWLEDSGLILRVNRLQAIDKPLKAYVELAIFKVYMFDTGLLISQFHDEDVKSIVAGDLGIYAGALYENVVACEWKTKGMDCYYFEPNHSSEIDFIAHLEEGIVPIEVKAVVRTKSSSFDNYVSKYKPNLALRFSQKNFGTKDNVQYYP